MDIIKNDVLLTFLEESKSNSKENIKLEISKINYLNNTSNIYNIYHKELNLDYICKIFDITKNDTKKYLGENEFYFYKNMFNNVKNIINIPNFYGFIKNENNEIYGLLLQKINNINIVNIDNINKIINHISKLHIFYWNNFNDNVFCEHSNFIIETKVKAEAKYYFDHIPHVFDYHLFNLFNQLFSKKIENINNNKDKNNNKTFIHGSLKIENIMLVEENNDIVPYFIDWGLYKIGYGIEDILFLLIFSFNENLFQEHNEHLLQNYFIKINQFYTYEYEDFIIHIKLSLLDFILHAIIGLFIKNHFSKVKNEKLNIYLKNYLHLIDKYNI